MSHEVLNYNSGGGGGSSSSKRGNSRSRAMFVNADELGSRYKQQEQVAFNRREYEKDRRELINLQIHFDNMKKDKDLQIASLERIIKQLNKKLKHSRNENKELDATLSVLYYYYCYYRN